MALTVAEVKNAKPGERGYKLADSAGLHLFVSTKGAKSLRFKYRIGKTEKRLTFGLFPEVSLADARDRRDAARALVRIGKDPVVEAEKIDDDCRSNRRPIELIESPAAIGPRSRIAAPQNSKSAAVASSPHSFSSKE